MSEENIVEIQGVRLRRGQRYIFDGLDISIPRGSVTAIMGPSGVGKSTLLHLLTGQVLPDRGSIVVAGEEVTRLAGKRLYALRKRMGMLFQNGALLTDYSVYENVAFPLRENTALPERLIRHIVLLKLQAVGLRGALELMPSELSGGMARRVALARAMALDPEILIYDEPFVGLDPISLGVVLRLIRRMNDALDITSIVVSHDVEEVAEIADRTYLLSDGKVVASGSPDDLARDRSAMVRQFMTGLSDGPVPFHYPAPDFVDQLIGQSEQ